jgi:NTE family protein
MAQRQYPHRALVLQGGGALGAYEAGVVKALCEKLMEEDKQKGIVDRPLFDIVAGSSIGAVNAAILVNQVVNGLRGISPRPRISDTWRMAVDTLEDFWKKDIADYNYNLLLDNPWVKVGMTLWWGLAQITRESWNLFWKSIFQLYGVSSLNEFRRTLPFVNKAYYMWPDNYGPVASGEAARKYYSYVFATLGIGIPGVLRSGMPQGAAMKFLNPFADFFWRFDNTPLSEALRKYYWINNHDPVTTTTTATSSSSSSLSGATSAGIQTTEGEPRLLLVAVDIQDLTTAVTFDSYPKKDGRHYSEYGREDKEANVIRYDDGITINHLSASMSGSQRYEFPFEEVELEGKEGRKEYRYFWDGAYLSNTPLRQVLHYHRDYWLNFHGPKKEAVVPDLEVYIVNLYPSIEHSIPHEPDSIQDRETDISFHDRTVYDLKVAKMTTDYIDLARQLRDIVNDKDLSKALSKEAKKVLEDKIKNIMEKSTKISNKRNGEERKNWELLEGRFDVTRAVYVERQDDKDTIYGKAFDFSYSTIHDLFEKGYQHGEDAYIQTIEKEKARAEGLREEKP